MNFAMNRMCNPCKFPINLMIKSWSVFKPGAEENDFAMDRMCTRCKFPINLMVKSWSVLSQE